LEAWSGVRTQDLYIRQDQVSAEEAVLTALLDVVADSAWEGVLSLASEEHVWTRKVSLQPGRNLVELQAVIPEPELWWCRGLGAPRLYTFTAELMDVAGAPVAAKSVRTGLRSIKLIRDKDAAGESFLFELNGVPVFAKGANHIPNDSFVTEVTPERYRHEIESAVLANMNMLRVWGGGIYEQDVFYELCDEYGLLVWQDFMFACSMYPGDADFLASVRREAEENVTRLRNHPCIALWCGNNEIDSAWAHYDEKGGWGWKQPFSMEQREKIWQDYLAIFHRVLPEVVAELAPGTDYWPSSPMQTLQPDGSRHSTQQTTGSGDIHYWGVWHASEPFENYNSYVGRFMSEYGFQSFPEPRTVRSYAEEEQMELESEVMLSHQRHPRGNPLIKEYMDRYMQKPKDFPSFLHMSQALQAEAMKSAFEAHRRGKPHCMGTLYWQMNDCWPVASWAGMDYYGRWKAMHYEARRCFRDVAVSLSGGAADGEASVYVVSDKPEAVELELLVEWKDFRGQTLRQWSQVVLLEANGSRRALQLPVEELVERGDPDECVLIATLTEAGTVLDRKTHYLVPGSQIRLPKPTLRVTERKNGDVTELLLETDVLAKRVWLAAEEEGVFSDNSFDLIPGMPIAVSFLGRSSGGSSAFAAANPGQVEIRSLYDWISVE